MIDLYFAPTANGQRASVALEECGLPYRVHRLDLAGGEQRRPAFLAINPAGMIPAIVDPDGPGGRPFSLSQSGAIVLYAARKGGRLMPTDPEAQMVALQWVLQVASDVACTSGSIFRLEHSAPEKSAANLAYFRQRLVNFFADCDRQLRDRDYLAGELSVADVMLYPNYVARKAILDEAGGLEHLHRWAASMAARPGVRRGMTPGG